MFDKRLMELCPESRKFIVGNIVLQWIELFLNAVMIGLIASAAEKLYRREMTAADAILPVVIIAVTILVRFFTSRYAVRMSYLASRTVKRKMRDLIYKKLLKLGMSYREKVTTAELVQEAVEGVENWYRRRSRELTSWRAILASMCHSSSMHSLHPSRFSQCSPLRGVCARL